MGADRTQPNGSPAPGEQSRSDGEEATDDAARRRRGERFRVTCDECPHATGREYPTRRVASAKAQRHNEAEHDDVPTAEVERVTRNAEVYAGP